MTNPASPKRSTGDMPAVGGLDNDEVDAIIDFIRSEQQRQGFEPYERP